jgi:hypothetical protein
MNIVKRAVIAHAGMMVLGCIVAVAVVNLFSLQTPWSTWAAMLIGACSQYVAMAFWMGDAYGLVTKQ